MLIRVIPFLAFLLVYVNSQEILTQEVGGGYQRPTRKQNRQVPRYYICGAGTWIKKQVTPASQKCQRLCRKKKKWFRTYRQCYNHCVPIPAVHHWTRINGLRFQFCHFQDWNNQYTMQEAGNYDWQGVKMCPQGMYVYGMRTKVSEKDGLAGLILYCRNTRTTSNVAEIRIFDGEGAWRDVVASGNYAVGYRVRMRDSWIYGLKLQMAALPHIFAFNFKYSFPKNFNTAPIQIEKVTVSNYGTTPMIKQIEISKEKQFQRIWNNERGHLHGQSISQISSQTLTATVSVGVPFLSRSKNSNTQKQQLTQSRREQRFQTFKFGNMETFKIGQKQKDIINVPACSRYTILQTVYISDSDVPYVLQLGYSNGQAVEYQNIGGFYRGVAVGEVETTVHMENICKQPS